MGDLIKKILGVKNFENKPKVLADFSKVFNSWIKTTSEVDGASIFKEKNIGSKYANFYKDTLFSNKDV